MKNIKTIVALFMLFFIISFSSASALTVAVSIKPLYSLVAMVTDGVSAPVLIVKGNASPHDINLSAKNIKQIKNTDVVFIASKNLEIPIYEALEQQNNLYQMVNFEGLNLLDFSANKIIFKEDSHYIKGHRHHHHDELSGTDFHIWLDPKNAEAILVGVSNILSQKDPTNAAKYQANVIKYSKKLEDLNNQLTNLLSPYKTASFIFYHNGFAYLENRYGLSSKGIIQTGDHAAGHFLSNTFSNKKLIELDKFIKNNNISCVFLEPQFSDKVLLRFLKERKVNYTTLDPIGYNLTANKELYFKLLLQNANAFKKCFKKNNK